MYRKWSYLIVLLLLLMPLRPALAQESNTDTTVFLPLIGSGGVAADAGIADALDVGDAALTDNVVGEDESVVAAGNRNGAVFVMTNANDPIRGNEIVMYRRASDGTLTVTGRFPTGGQGLGSGLGSQGAVTLSENGRWLFVVNAGSNELAVFAVHEFGLELTDNVNSGGIQPTSVTVRRGLVYVLNAGDAGNITGFILRNNGALTPIGDSTRSLSNNGSGAAPAPAQVAFTPNGKALLVTERSSNLIDSYTVERNGQATGPVAHISAGTTPFGFAFAKNDTLVISEAFGGAINGSAASSYQLDKHGTPTVVSSSIPTNQSAACWVVVTNDGKYAYTTNAGSASLSLFQVDKYGELTLLNSRAGETGDGTGPTDAAVSHNGRLIYALSARSQTIIGFSVQADGSLVSVGSFAGLPANAAGIAAW